MLKLLFSAALSLTLLGLPLPAAAFDYTDIWYLFSESGWGINLIQADNVIFATFFVYGPGNVPTWYVATIYSDANGNFSGTLYATVGTYFGMPWNPKAFAGTPVGTASFAPTSAYTGTLTYTITGGPTVVKNIQRQTLQPIALGGKYIGGQGGSYAGNCSFTGSYKDTFNAQVSQAGGTATFSFSYTSGLSCTLSGTLVQYGQLYTMPNASYQCSDGANTTATVDEIKATAHGIEATFAVRSGSQGTSGCREAAAFSGALL